MTLAVIVARQRSGTGALGSVLDQQPQIRYLGEVFHHDAIDRPPNFFHFLRGMVAEDADLALPGAAADRFKRYAEYVQSYSGRDCTVLDIKYTSLHHFNGYWIGPLEKPQVVNLLRANRSPIIHLKRSNALKRFISGQLAELNDEWHAKAHSDLTVHSLRVDPAACLRFIKGQVREARRMNEILNSYPNLIELEYAELFDDSGELRESIADKLAKFLGVPTFNKRKPAFIKQASDDLASVIENHDEVSAALRQTPHAWMLSKETPGS